jgi:hypothetical protein
VVVLPASICAMMPILRTSSMGVSRAILLLLCYCFRRFRFVRLTIRFSIRYQR